jgi:hypothetical protein
VRIEKRSILFEFFGGRLGNDDLGDEHEGADDDGAIGNVEGRPMIGAEVEIHKIDDVACSDSVPEIAECAAEDEGETDARGVERVGVLPQQVGDNGHRDKRRENQKGELPFGGGFGEEAERGAAILNVRQAEAGEYANTVVERDGLLDRPLCGAIDQQHQGCDEDMKFAHSAN